MVKIQRIVPHSMNGTAEIKLLNCEQLIDAGFEPGDLIEVTNGDWCEVHIALQMCDPENGIGSIEDFRLMYTPDPEPLIKSSPKNKPWYRQGEKY